MHILFRVSCLLAALFFSARSFSEAGNAQASPQALVSVEALLKQAAVSVREKTYKGRFTYEFGNVLETLELVHSVEAGLEQERILHLSGHKREFLMAGHRSDCVSVGSLLLRGASFTNNGKLQKLDQNYHFYIGADQRVAGRDVAMVQVVPKDDYRYGMTMGFDKLSGLPLLSLIANKKTIIERFQFVALTVGEAISAADLEPTSGAYRKLHAGNGNCAKSNNNSGVKRSNWTAGWAPSGFVLSQVGPEPGYDEVLTYTDGLASFSLFIVASEGAVPDSIKEAFAQRGATLVLMNQLEVRGQAYDIMLVGEIPMVTAKKVFASVRPVP